MITKSRLVAITLAVVCASLGELCRLNESDPLVRMEQILINTKSETGPTTFRRIWVAPEGTHLTPYRINGGFGPGAPSSI